jgi:hypothetical protein
MNTEFIKKCPKCDDNMYYINKYVLCRAIKNNTICNKGNCKSPIDGWNVIQNGGVDAPLF